MEKNYGMRLKELREDRQLKQNRLLLHHRKQQKKKITDSTEKIVSIKAKKSRLKKLQHLLLLRFQQKHQKTKRKNHAEIPKR